MCLWLKLYSSGQPLSSVSPLHESQTSHCPGLGDDEEPLRLLRLLPNRQPQHIAPGRNEC
jgi:hypothetical protein